MDGGFGVSKHSERQRFEGKLDLGPGFATASLERASLGYGRFGSGGDCRPEPDTHSSDWISG